MRSGFYLDSWQKKSLRNFFKMEVSKFYDEMQMPECAWRDLQEHCKREVQKIVDFHKERINKDEELKSLVAYYKELGRICVFKLMEAKNGE